VQKQKIIIAGIGGVGGYFGGLLAHRFENSDRAAVYFVARGQHLKQIKTNGLNVKKGDHTFIAKPELATDQPSEIGIADLIIISTKSYDLEAMMEQLAPCINKDTILLPLLNGVDSREKIKKMFPEILVLDGCVYIVARLTEPGFIENKGNIQKLYFGLDGIANKRLTSLEQLMKEAGIEAFFSQTISTVIWEKFIFISPTAAATSYFDSSIGAILADTEKLSTLDSLMEEIKQIANAKQITISKDITDKTLKILHALPYETTSSMHTDILNGKPVSEIESLIAYVVKEGEKNNLSMPVYKQVYKVLQEAFSAKLKK
jgi:2-dehydropantoate 2-reductase